MLEIFQQCEGKFDNWLKTFAKFELYTNLHQIMAKSFTLENIPEDVFEFLLDKQSEIKKEKKKGMFGLCQTVFAIVRDYKRCRESEQTNTK